MLFLVQTAILIVNGIYCETDVENLPKRYLLRRSESFREDDLSFGALPDCAVGSSAQGRKKVRTMGSVAAWNVAVLRK